jgi:hypothetical protein|tara:strand:- start:3535 stop:3771 length:237 start_codon:yes stop_codon:yes gene_type:complete
MNRRGRPADKKLYVSAVVRNLPNKDLKEEEISIIKSSLTKMTCVELTMLVKSLSPDSKCSLPDKTDAQKNRLKILGTA